MDQQAVEKALRIVHDNMTQESIKETIDFYGIDAFINQSALLAAGSGFATGAAGAVGSFALMPVDIAVLLYQQIRIAVGVTYYRTGTYKPSFHAVLKIVALGVGARAVAAGAVIGTAAFLRTLSEEALVKLISQVIVKKVSSQVITKVVPGVGGLFGAGFNFITIAAYGRMLSAIDKKVIIDLVDIETANQTETP